MATPIQEEREHEFRTLEYVKENCRGIVDQLLSESEDEGV